MFNRIQLKSVSVIIILNKKSQFLGKCLNSVLVQAECLEVFIIRLDETACLLNQHHESDPRVNVLSCSKDLLSQELNYVLSQINGLYFSILRAEDQLQRNSFRLCIQEFSDFNSPLAVIGQTEFLSIETGARYSLPMKRHQTNIERKYLDFVASRSAIMFKRVVLVLNGSFCGNFNEAFEFEYLIRLYLNFPSRIGLTPFLLGSIFIEKNSLFCDQFEDYFASEMQIISHYFKEFPISYLQKFVLLSEYFQAVPCGDYKTHVHNMFSKVAPLIPPEDKYFFMKNFLLDKDDYSQNLKFEENKKNLNLHESPGGQLLQAVHPEISLNYPCPTRDKFQRFNRAFESYKSKYPYLEDIILDLHDNYDSSNQLNLFQHRPFGVNLIGHAFDVFGIGEDLRMAAKALNVAKVPISIFDYPARNNSVRDLSLLDDIKFEKKYNNKCPYSFNIICMTASIYARWILENGQQYLKDRYTIVIGLGKHKSGQKY